MREIKYQVISVYDGIWHHEGFFAGEQHARDMRNWVAANMECDGIDGEVFVNEIKR